MGLVVSKQSPRVVFFRPGSESGLVTFIVIVLVMLLSALLVANAYVLAHVKAELKRVEARQLKSTAMSATVSNAPTATTTRPP